MWTPADLGSALLGWFDGSDAATVTITGSGVSAWSNKGVSSFTLTQGLDAYRPSYAANSVIFADNTSQYLAAGNPPSAYDLLVVAKPNSYNDWRTLLLSVSGNPTENTILIQNTGQVGIYNQNFFQAGGLTWANNTSGLCYAQISTAGPVLMSRDGGALASTGIAQLGFPLEGVGSSGSYQSHTYTQAFGTIYELFFVPYNSSADTRQRLEGYSAWKWGLQGLLPSGHPYKAAPPDGAINIAPVGIASTNAFGTATVVPGTIGISATGIASTTVFGTGSLARGAVNIAPSGIASTLAFGTASLTTLASISPAGIASVTAFGNAAVSRGAVNIAPTGIASTTLFGTASISSLVISPAGIASTTIFGTPVISTGPVAISPSGLPSTTTVGVPSVFIPPNPVGRYAGYPQGSQIVVPATIYYREEWEEGPWVMPPYGLIFPQAPVPEPEERGADSFHHEWLKTHQRPPGPRRLGDNNHRPQSVLPPFVRPESIMVKPMWMPKPRRMDNPPPPRLPPPAPVPSGVPIQTTETEEGPWVMPPYVLIFPPTPDP